MNDLFLKCISEKCDTDYPRLIDRSGNEYSSWLGNTTLRKYHCYLLKDPIIAKWTTGRDVIHHALEIIDYGTKGNPIKEGNILL